MKSGAGAFAAALLSLAAAGAGADKPEAGGAKVGQVAPDFTLPRTTGESLRLSSLRGQVVLLDFWATWCEPCRRELPELVKLHRERAGRGLAVVAVNLDEERAPVDKFLAESPLPFPVALDPQATVAAKYRLPKMPSSYVIDRAGVIRRVQVGFSTDDVKPLRAAIEAALAAPAAR